MQNFKEVSLGFAEFVAQLIQESFDAILSSQNYQLERYAELESKLNLSAQSYTDKYISDEQIKDKMLENFGFEVTKEMEVNQAFMNYLKNTFNNVKDMVDESKKLTETGYKILATEVANILVDEQKAMLSTLLTKSNVSNLVVDSGQITAKLSLANLYQSNQEDKSEPTPTPVEPPANISNPTLTPGFTPGNLGNSGTNMPFSRSLAKVIEVQNPDTGNATVLLDKASLENIGKANFQIPNVRLSVQPAKITQSSNLYSEIKINFKTV